MRFRTEINRAWLCALRRRSQKARNLTWDRIKRLIKTWIPTAKIQASIPEPKALRELPEVGAV